VPVPDAPDAIRPVVLLAGPGDTTDIVANYLAPRVPQLVVVVEESPSRVTMARRRAARIGWPTVIGQVLFVTTVLPLLRWRGRRRIDEIVARAGLDTTPRVPVHHVESVNGDDTIALLRDAAPVVVVVNGTRIISSAVLGSVGCQFVNTHAGTTPRYRGVHGGYWALAEGHPELVGTTVHLVDEGIDTGSVLARARFAVTRADSIATYPYLHLAAGLPHLADQVERAVAGERLTPRVEDPPVGGSRLYLHPTLWEYLRRRIVDGVR
jgi:folate-dependent phosphoribosylglycinamide formyltransferase PurN